MSKIGKAIKQALESLLPSAPKNDYERGYQKASARLMSGCDLASLQYFMDNALKLKDTHPDLFVSAWREMGVRDPVRFGEGFLARLAIEKAKRPPERIPLRLGPAAADVPILPLTDIDVSTLEPPIEHTYPSAH